MSRLVIAGLVGLAVGGITSLSATVRADDHDIRLVGCLVRGEDATGYLLTNVPGETPWQRSTDATVVPGPIGTAGAVATIFYWLDEKGSLEEHVGHQIEIEGTLRSGLKEGEIKLDRKPGWTEVEIKSDGRSLKARVPHRAADEKMTVLVRQVDPKRVRMLSAACR